MPDEGAPTATSRYLTTRGDGRQAGETAGALLAFEVAYTGFLDDMMLVRTGSIARLFDHGCTIGIVYRTRLHQL